jgi:hypothetical protein
VVTALLIGAVGLAFIVGSWPRRVKVRVDTQARVVLEGDAHTAFTEAATFHLIPIAPRTPGGRPVYGVTLHPRDGDAHCVLIATTDPGEALADLTRVQAYLRLPVCGGWGLPSSAPWVDTVSGPRPSGPDTVAEERAGRRRASTAMLVGSVAIALGIARTVQGRIATGQYPAALSIVLPALGVTAMFVLAVALATSETTLHFDGELVSERRLFGRSLARRTVKRGAIRAAYLVSPDGNAPRHLLIDTDDGPRSFPYNDERPGDIGSLLSR